MAQHLTLTYYTACVAVQCTQKRGDGVRAFNKILLHVLAPLQLTPSPPPPPGPHTHTHTNTTRGTIRLNTQYSYFKRKVHAV